MKKKNEKQFFSLSKKANQIIWLLTNNKNFNKDAESLRKKYLTTQKKSKNKETIYENLSLLLDDAEKLRVKYGLPEPYFPLLSLFIEYGESILNENPELFYKKHQHKIIKNQYGEDVIYIPIYPETTIKDIKESFNAVKKIAEKFYWNKRRYKRLRQIPTLKNQIKVAAYKRSGLTDNEVKEKFNKELSPVDKDYCIGKNDVPKIEKKLKKTARKLLKNKAKKQKNKETL